MKRETQIRPSLQNISLQRSILGACNDSADQCWNDIRERSSSLSVQAADFLATTAPCHSFAATILLMAGYHQGLHRRSKQNTQSMIPFSPYRTSYSSSLLPYGTISNCWNITQRFCVAIPTYKISWVTYGCIYIALSHGLLSEYGQ